MKHIERIWLGFCMLTFILGLISATVAVFTGSLAAISVVVVLGMIVIAYYIGMIAEWVLNKIFK